ncbi:MAG: SulP family inorganic anion transporter, partial [Dehalococcoidia bacterium]|nr:SulP family inorganic anion transporter [Dehalococcoidia bacterium]
MTYRLPQAMPRVSYSLDTFRGDIFGGITSAVVGLPIALAFGVASGLGAAAGLYGAIAVGFFAAVFGGTRSQISGPTAPTSVAMAVIFTVHADGDLSKALAIAMMAGVIQILLGALRIGRFISYTPYSVTSGFMSGIGIIIIIIQTLPFLGWAVPTGGPLKAMRSWPEVLGDVNFEAF